MKEFEYFLFENFDADSEANNPRNPRNFLGKETDGVLSEIGDQPANSYSYHACCEKYSTGLVRKLISGGVLRENGSGLSFDCPIFLREDAEVLHREIALKASALVDLLEGSLSDIRACCAGIHNGFSVERNLYHILCGMVFDGRFFDSLSNRGVLAASRQHPSGLDYLTVIYEKCDELQALSDGLLCSYNRLVNEQCSLQSFGDAQGNRFDLYRFFRLMEQGKLPTQFKRAEKLLQESFCGANKDALLSETVSLLKTGRCVPGAMALLELFGYVHDSVICVPVYMPEHQNKIIRIGDIAEECLGYALADTLMVLADTIDITAVRHGVNRLEIANELYHILFGSMNEELAARGIVVAPKNIPGEGRYLKCIEVYL